MGPYKGQTGEIMGYSSETNNRVQFYLVKMDTDEDLWLSFSKSEMKIL